MTSPDLIATLVALHQRSGLSITVVARKAGMSKTTLAAYLRGDMTPSTTNYAKCLAVYGYRLAIIPATAAHALEVAE